MNLGNILEESHEEEFQQNELESIDVKKLMYDPKETDQQIQDFFNGKIKKGLGIGIPAFDKYIVLKEKSLYASVGKKGRGKSTIDQLLRLMWSIVHGVKHVCLYKENTAWQVKLSLLDQLLGVKAKEVQKTDDLRYIRALDFINNHFIFTRATTKKEAMLFTERLIHDGENIHSLVLDPSNSIPDGFESTGNGFEDGVKGSQKVLDFALNVASVFVSQHPNMYAQRQKEDVNSEQAEGGYYFNKAHFAFSINREREENQTRIRVESVRNKLTGGNVTGYDNPVLINWSPYKIGIEADGQVIEDVIGQLVNRHLPQLRQQKDVKPIKPMTYSDSFGEDTPF